jgi:hypothetical protein
MAKESLIKKLLWTGSAKKDLMAMPSDVKDTLMLNCLARLGRDVQIVVGPSNHATSVGHVTVVFSG